MAKSGSVIQADLESVRGVIRSDVQAGYPELTKLCQDLMGDDSNPIPCVSLLSYYANGGKDSKDAVATSFCFTTVFGGVSIHNMIDDDGNVIGFKRGIFSKPVSTTKIVVAGDFMYAMGFRNAYQKAPCITGYLVEASSRIANGDFEMIGKKSNPDFNEKDCIEIMSKRTSSIYEAIALGSAKCADSDLRNEGAMREFASNLGLIVHISGDLADTVDTSSKKAVKGLSIQCGVPTLPILYATEDPDVGRRIREIFSKDKKSKRDVDDVIVLMRKTDALERCRSLMSGYADKAEKALSSLPDSEYKTELCELARKLAQ